VNRLFVWFEILNIIFNKHIVYTDSAFYRQQIL